MNKITEGNQKKMNKITEGNQNSLVLFLGLLTILMIILKVTYLIDIGWIYVFFPILMPTAFILCVIFVAMVLRVLVYFIDGK